MSDPFDTTSLPGENWLPVPGWEGSYEVSDLGRIRSIDRRVKSSNDGRTRVAPGRVIKSWTTSGHREHPMVSLGHHDHRFIHILVLEAFVGPRPTEGRWEACHNDGDGHNNALSNLRWDTASNNQRDRLKHGTHHFANRTHCKWGHEYTPENTAWRVRTGPRYVTPSRARVCKKCRADRYAKSRQDA